MAVGQPEAAGFDASDVRGGGVDGGGETGPDGFWVPRRQHGQQSTGPRGELRNDFRIDCSVEAHILGGGSGDGEAIGTLENVGVMVTDGGRERSGREAVTEQVAFHWKGTRERVGLPIDGDGNAAAPGAGCDDGAARVETR